MSYITATQYNTISGRDQSEATDARIERASLLLDARCGLDRHADSDDDDKEFLIDKDDLNARQKKAVEQWTAWLVASLAKSNDSPQVVEDVRLGRFQVRAQDGRQVRMVSDDMMYADQLLVSTGMVRRDVDSHPNQILVHREL